MVTDYKISADTNSLGIFIPLDIFLRPYPPDIHPRVERRSIGEQTRSTSRKPDCIERFDTDTIRNQCADIFFPIASSPRESRRLRERTAAPPRIVLDVEWRMTT